MKGEDFLAVAKTMLQLRTEAASRSAISRAYYALFNSGSHLLRELGVTIAQSPSGMEKSKTASSTVGLIKRWTSHGLWMSCAPNEILPTTTWNHRFSKTKTIAVGLLPKRR